MSWKNKLEHCFGLADRRFAGHPSDEQRAFEVLMELRADNVGWEEIEKVVRAFLQGNQKLHVEEQVKLVKTYFRPWVLD